MGEKTTSASPVLNIRLQGQLALDVRAMADASPLRCSGAAMAERLLQEALDARRRNGGQT